MSLPVDVLFEYSALNGGERSWLALLPGIRSVGFVPRAIIPSYPADHPHPLAMELARCDVPCRPLAYHDGDGVRRPLEAIRADLAVLLSDDPPRMLHANSLATSRLAGPVCRQLGLCSVGHLRDIVKLSRQVVADTSCHRRLLAVSRATRDYHLAQGFREDQLHVCYNGIDCERFASSDHPSESLRKNYGDDARLLMSIGQISLRKGFDTIAAACLRLFERDKTMHWIVLGERHSEKPETVRFEQKLKAFVVRPPLAGRVHFLRFVENVRELLPQADLLVHAARQEPLGRVLLEAAACGVPVVATDVGGTREIFCRDLVELTDPTAHLVPPDDEIALSSAIEDAFANLGSTQSMARDALTICRERFDASRAAARLANHYAECCDAAAR